MHRFLQRFLQKFFANLYEKFCNFANEFLQNLQKCCKNVAKIAENFCKICKNVAKMLQKLGINFCKNQVKIYYKNPFLQKSLPEFLQICKIVVKLQKYFCKIAKFLQNFCNIFAKNYCFVQIYLISQNFCKFAIFAKIIWEFLQKSLRDLFQKFSSAPRGLGFCADRPVYEGVGVDKTSNFWYNNYGKENEGIKRKVKQQ